MRRAETHFFLRGLAEADAESPTESSVWVVVAHQLTTHGRAYH